jgi:hypothetical protein
MQKHFMSLRLERKALGRCWAPGKRSTHRQIIVVLQMRMVAWAKSECNSGIERVQFECEPGFPEGKNGEMKGGGGRPAAKPIYAPKIVEALHGVIGLASLVP